MTIKPGLRDQWIGSLDTTHNGKPVSLYGCLGHSEEECRYMLLEWLEEKRDLLSGIIRDSYLQSYPEQKAWTVPGLGPPIKKKYTYRTTDGVVKPPRKHRKKESSDDDDD